MLKKRIRWPEDRLFAFTIFDDTDLSFLENTAPIYAFLEAKGYRTTKSVWPLRGNKKPEVGGDTCENPQYLTWLQSLQEKGFEIGYHLATFHTSPREQTTYGLEQFYKKFGHYPWAMANHTGCDEGIYWGEHRLSGLMRLAYNLLTRYHNQGKFCGHLENHPYFWGDLCQEYVKYVRNFVFGDINTLKACPIMPYHDPKRPYVNWWFASSEGADAASFNRTISEKNQDRLEAEGGACIMYAHLGKDFCRNGRLNGRFKFLLERMAAKNGWFVPVSTLLDLLLQENGGHTINPGERAVLELKWLIHKALIGTT